MPSKPKAYFDPELMVLVIPEGACPHPIGDDDGTAADCIAHGNCGCDEVDKYLAALAAGENENA